MNEKILLNKNLKEDKFLRRPTKEFSFRAKGVTVDGIFMTFSEIDELIRKMRKIMKEAPGVGLSANQIGLPYRLFVAEVPDSQGNLKFYSIFNPRLEFSKKEKAMMEEGCLSVVGKYGIVPRFTEAKLSGLDKRGRALKIKAWGFLAHVFQHEVDHLDGKLFIDRTKNIYEISNDERLKKNLGK